MTTISQNTFHFEHLAVCDASQLSAEMLLSAYSQSYFPMAEDEGIIRWHSPDPRAIFPLEQMKLSRSLRKTLEKSGFECTFDQAFEQVITACSRRDTEDMVWISDELIHAYSDLHQRGIAHSIETWLDGVLVGGLYGVTFGAGFFGESMFSRVSNASKAAFVAMVTHLREADFQLLDTQYINHFTEQLGAIEIPRDEYLSLLADALALPRSFALSQS